MIYQKTREGDEKVVCRMVRRHPTPCGMLRLRPFRVPDSCARCVSVSFLPLSVRPPAWLHWVSQLHAHFSFYVLHFVCLFAFYCKKNTFLLASFDSEGPSGHFCLCYHARSLIRPTGWLCSFRRYVHLVPCFIRLGIRRAFVWWSRQCLRFFP